MMLLFLPPVTTIRRLKWIGGYGGRRAPPTFKCFRYFNCESILINYSVFVYVIGSCTDYTGAYSCTCDPGYSGQNCSIDIDECESSPCINGG